LRSESTKLFHLCEHLHRISWVQNLTNLFQYIEAIRCLKLIKIFDQKLKRKWICRFFKVTQVQRWVLLSNVVRFSRNDDDDGAKIKHFQIKNFTKLKLLFLTLLLFTNNVFFCILSLFNKCRYFLRSPISYRLLSNISFK
jgi:hypothetical protein